MSVVFGRWELVREECVVSDLKSELTGWIAADITLDPSVEITADTELLVSGLVDSLGVVQIVAWLEDRLGARIDPADVVLENFETAATIAEFAEGLQRTVS